MIVFIIFGSFSFMDKMNSKIQDHYFNEKQDLVTKTLSSNMQVDSAAYSASKSVIQLTNSGSNKISLEHLDVYVDGQRIPRSAQNRTIDVLSSSELANPGLWDPQETLEINITKSLSAGNHRIDIVNEYGIKVVTKVTA